MYSVQMRENSDQKKSEFGHFSRSVMCGLIKCYNVTNPDIIERWKLLFFSLQILFVQARREFPGLHVDFRVSW